jgi:UDP-galactopyranose mutase
VFVVVPHLPGAEDQNRTLEALLLEFAERHAIRNPVLWFYTPMALEFVPSSIRAAAVVYDCMDELSLFRGAPARLQQLERALLAKTDVLFTGGVSLFEAKRELHANAHAAPSGVDRHHFLQARSLPVDFAEQSTMPYPRLGYAGVIDERIDLDLIDVAARRKPEWQFVMIGPIAKIAPESRPQQPNIHWLGMKEYGDLPKYFAGWDVGIMPFALNEATRFISPTKTPEYLAAGLPVVSTAIKDVVRLYGESGMAAIAHSVEDFVAEASKAMLVRRDARHRHEVDSLLHSMSWDSVWERMDALISDALAAREKNSSFSPAAESLLHAVELQPSVSLA